MATDEPHLGPLQLLVVGFESTERFDGRMARELRDLRGRGLIRVVDARLLSRSPEGGLGDTDLNQVIGDPFGSPWRPAAHLFGLNGAGDGGSVPGLERSGRPGEEEAGTVGFALEDLHRVTAAIPPGEHAAVLLIEHVWAARLRSLVRDRGGRLVAQGMLTPEVTMLVGAELQAKADAEAAIELADAARGAALLDALSTLTGEGREAQPSPPAAAAAVVGALVDAGFVRDCEAGDAIEALAERGIVEQALLHGAVAETEELLRRHEAEADDEPPPPAR